MAVTNQELFNIFLANPNMSDAQIVSLMETRGISPKQVSSTFNIPLADVESRYNAALPFVNPVIEERVIDMGEGTRSEYYIKGTNIQADAPTFSETASTTGLTESSAPEFKANNITIYDPQAKGEYVYTPEGKLIGFNPGERDSSFGGFLNEVYQDSKGVIIPALTFGALNAAGLLGGAASTTAAATEGLTLAELGLGGSELGAVTNVADVVAGTQGGLLTGGAEAATAFELANAGIAGGAATFTPAQLALIEAGATAAEVAAAGGGLLTSTAADAAAFELQNAGASALTDLSATQGGLLTPPVVTPPTGIPPIVSTLVAPIVNSLVNPDTVSGLLQTTGSLVQSQESKDAALKAATDITKATQAGVEGSQFRPIGMTTRFGTSEYKYDPVTGRMTSAGYQLSPEAKNAQDRLVKLARSGLQQAEGAQAQFAPLQTGAQSLFSLGNQYISRSPQDVAQNYLNQQMQLLQPGREMELANLQNTLQQQGRAGLSVAQGGTMGATTPELQALYNARARQEAELAANAQQLGQRDVLFGAGLLGQGATAMGNYYGGQQAAYSPFTTAVGQVQNLETQAQQPLMMGAKLAEQASLAGYRAGSLGVEGQKLANVFNTGANATYNPYAGLLTAAGNPNSMFGQSIAKYLSGDSTTPFDALSSVKYGDGLAGYEKMIADIYGT
jgi:hypothetical protein